MNGNGEEGILSGVASTSARGSERINRTLTANAVLVFRVRDGRSEDGGKNLSRRRNRPLLRL